MCRISDTKYHILKQIKKRGKKAYLPYYYGDALEKQLEKYPQLTKMLIDTNYEFGAKLAEDKMIDIDLVRITMPNSEEATEVRQAKLRLNGQSYIDGFEFDIWKSVKIPLIAVFISVFALIISFIALF